MRQYHLIDSKGNKLVMSTEEFYQHKLLNERKATKDILQFDLDWYLSHGYCTLEDFEKRMKEKYGL